MIHALAPEGGRLRPVDEADHHALARAVWIDLVDPTDEEKQRVERATGLQVSTEAELQEIESSSRVSEEESGDLYMSMPLVHSLDRSNVRTTSLGFVLNKDRLLTVRFARSGAFETLLDRAQRFEEGHRTSAHVLVTLLEIVVDRLADELEKIRDELDAISRRIFEEEMSSGRAPRREDEALRRTLRAIGNAGDLVSRIRDSLLGIGRIPPFVAQAGAAWLPADLRARGKTLRQDIASLSDYDAHLTNKVQFLLDATLGFINIAQNTIMKAFTVFSVAGIPPVLIAGIYGMNFKYIPEYDWAWGYPYGIALIVVSAIIPLIAFKWRGWL